MLELKTSYSLSHVPYISYEALDEYATAVVEDYMPERLKIPAPLDVIGFIENYLGLEMVYYKLCYENKVLGFTAFHDGIVRILEDGTSLIKTVPVKGGTVIIEKSLRYKRSIRRLRFTSVHEGSHWLLHRKTFANDNPYGNMGAFNISYLAAKTGRMDYSRSKLEKTDKDRMERQADFLAAGILMPLPALRITFRKFFNSIGIKPRVLVRTNPNDEVLVKQLVVYIAETFEVSNHAALIRLEKLSAIVNKEVRTHEVI